MTTTPLFLNYFFIFLTAFTIFQFYRASGKHTLTLLILLSWAALQGILAYSGFFLTSNSEPPRVVFVIVPTLVFMLVLFNTQGGKAYIDRLSLPHLTFLHSVRIGVELCIFLLFTLKLMPQSMTFEGRNFDLISGITAPLMAYFYFYRKSISTKMIFWWNVVCLGLVLHVVVYGIRAVPSPAHILLEGEANRAVLLFPFVWLPAIIVPIVIFSHFVAIRRFKL